MLWLLVVVAVAVPVMELWVFLQVAGWIGGWEALGLLLAISVFGAWLVMRQGMSAYRRGRADVAAHRVPGRAIVDGGIVASAGVLLVIPGFVTAAMGLLLLVPVVRVGIRERLIRRWTRRARLFTTGGRTADDRVVATTSVVVNRPSGSSGLEQLGGQRAIEAGDEPLG